MKSSFSLMPNMMVFITVFLKSMFEKLRASFASVGIYTLVRMGWRDRSFFSRNYTE